MPGKFIDSRINQNIEVATEYFRALVSEKTNNKQGNLKQSAGSIGFIPYNVSFTMDGMSGIKIYNELSLDTSFLPQGYSSTTSFIVTGVDHKIQNGDWETNITTTLIPRTNPIVNKVTGSLSIEGQREIPPTTTTNSTTNSVVTTGNDADFWSLLAMVTLESSDPQGGPDVAQSIYNRLQANLKGIGFGGDSLKKIITAHFQYQPAFLNISDGSQGIDPAWKAINNKDTAINALKVTYTKYVAAGYATSVPTNDVLETKLETTFSYLSDPARQQSAKTFVGNATDFRAQSAKGGIESSSQRSRTSSSNVFGFNASKGSYKGAFGQGSIPTNVDNLFKGGWIW
jgi:hypothetical protein